MSLDFLCTTRNLPFKDIPYLQLMKLPEVKDFCSLGNQRYLMIDDCPGVSSEAVSGFGNVFHLHVCRCHNIMEVHILQGNNQFLVLNSCFGVKSVKLSHHDYIHVKIIDCNGLVDFKNHGSVYSLDFTLNKRWTKEAIPRNYHYLKGEEEIEEAKDQEIIAGK
jgi:hypothetical protein